jgi:hypothetical protein
VVNQDSIVLYTSCSYLKGLWYIEFTHSSISGTMLTSFLVSHLKGFQFTVVMGIEVLQQHD